MEVPAIHEYSFHPWIEGFYQWYASDIADTNTNSVSPMFVAMPNL